MQSTHKIAGDDAQGFADYLTSTSSRGDYYLSGDGGAEDDGERGGGDGVWHGSPRALGALGLSIERPVGRGELVALMGGRSPASGESIRRAGGDGTRVAGIDMTFSAPKSVSALWAVGSDYRRAQIESAHRRAVASTMARMERDVDLVRCRQGGVLQWDRAQSVVAAEFLHTASRLTKDQERGGVPDPQLHSHVVVLAAQRQDGRFAAVDSREIFRAARANGAWYRSELAANLQQLGLEVDGRTGKDNRYFEVKGVPESLTERWSARSAEIEQRAREFRTRYGRSPKAGELSSITVETRGTKTVAAQVNVDQAWRAVAEEHGLSRVRSEELFAARDRSRGQVDLDRQAQQEGRQREQHELGPQAHRDLAAELLGDVTANASMVSDRDLHARLWELSAGVQRPEQARSVLDELEQSGELVRLEGGMWTSRELRDLEQRTVQAVEDRADQRAAPVAGQSVAEAVGAVEREIDGTLSDQQRHAVQTITGDGGVSVLVGQAGTGKGVVTRAASTAWQREGYTVIGTSIAGATAERLANDANLRESMTTDSLLARADQGHIHLDQRTVIVMDEAGMADTRRLSRLIEATERGGSKLVLVGDGAQLSPIGAGGLFDQIKDRAPHAELTEVRRARHPWERKAWQQIRDGNAAQALASYNTHQQLHITDTRQDAAQEIVRDWDHSRQQVGTDQTVILTDGSNVEIDHINLLAQQARDQRGELGQQRVPINDRPYSLATGDRVIFTASHPQPGQKRVENGTTGTISATSEDGWLQITTDGEHSRQVGVDTREFQGLKLAYAQHVYKAQGLTTERAHILIGGWQTDRGRAYVALTRARDRTYIHITRTDLGQQHLDPGTIQQLAETITQDNTQQASISRQEEPAHMAPAGLSGSERDVTAVEHPAPGAASSTKHEAEPRIGDRGCQQSGASLDVPRQEPQSEIGRILVEQEERERDEVERDEDAGFGIE